MGSYRLTAANGCASLLDMMRLQLAIFAAIVVTVAGCGGSASGTSSSSSSATSATTTTGDVSSAPAGGQGLAASVEAICARRYKKAFAIDAPGVTNERAFKAVARMRVGIEEQTSSELGKLSAPASMEPGWGQFVGYIRLLVKEWRIVSERGLAVSVIDSVEKTEGNMRAVANREGFKQCAAHV
jgi:hypothetical protein